MISRYLEPFRRGTLVWRTDRRTNGIAIAIAASNTLDARQKQRQNIQRHRLNVLHRVQVPTLQLAISLINAVQSRNSNSFHRVLANSLSPQLTSDIPFSQIFAILVISPSPPDWLYGFWLIIQRAVDKVIISVHHRRRSIQVPKRLKHVV